MSNGRKELSPNCLAHLIALHQQAVELNDTTDQDIQDADAAGAGDVVAFFRQVHEQNVVRAATAQRLLQQWGAPAAAAEEVGGGPPKIQTPIGGGGGGPPKIQTPIGDVIGGGGGGPPKIQKPQGP